MNYLEKAQTAAAVPQEQAHALAQCEAARRLEEAGRYEEARAALYPWWTLVGQMPQLQGLGQLASAQVLLRAGSLSGWIGRRQKVEGAHEFARNLLLRSISLFKKMSHPAKVAEALLALAVCYWHVEDFDYASDLLEQALGWIRGQDDVLRATILLNSAIIARAGREYERAFDLLTQAAPLFDKIEDTALLGRLHSSYAISLDNKWTATRDESYLDRALEEYAAASHLLEEVGYKHQSAAARNNLAMLLSEARRYDEAHENLNRAEGIFKGLKDRNNTAQVEETRARVYLNQGCYQPARRAAEAAVSILRQSAERSRLVDALITRGRVMARLNLIPDALRDFQEAQSIADEDGDLKAAQSCVQARIGEIAATACLDVGLAYEEATHSFEHGLFQRALIQARGKVTHAARLLGLERRSFTWILNDRHRDLLHLRIPAKKRSRSLLSRPQRSGTESERAAERNVRLYVLPHRKSIGVEFPPRLLLTGEHFAIQMSTDRLAGLGVAGGDWAVVRRGEAPQGDPVALRELTNSSLYAVGYLQSDGDLVRLLPDNSDFDELPFSKDGISIEGTIVGYCRREDIRLALQNHEADFKLRVFELNL
jgi:tetratricopeptide (TPR) repeat protein